MGFHFWTKGVHPAWIRAVLGKERGLPQLAHMAWCGHCASLCLMRTCLTSWKASMCKTTRRPSPTSSARRSRVRWPRKATPNKPAVQRQEPAWRKPMLRHPTCLSQKQHPCRNPRLRHRDPPLAQGDLQPPTVSHGAGTVIITDHVESGCIGREPGTTVMTAGAAGSTGDVRLV